MANLILDKTYLFSEKILNVYFFLRSKGHLRLADQLVGSGSSIGANVEEAQAAHSKVDFISKLTIANKEARETRYWLRLFDRNELLKEHPDFQFLKSEIDEIEHDGSVTRRNDYQPCEIPCGLKKSNYNHMKYSFS